MSKVVIYSSDTCPNCFSAKEYLRERDVDFIERNIQKDKEAKKELVDMGHMGVPILIINGEEVVGFNRAKIDTLLDK